MLNVNGPIIIPTRNHIDFDQILPEAQKPNKSRLNNNYYLDPKIIIT